MTLIAAVPAEQDSLHRKRRLWQVQRMLVLIFSVVAHKYNLNPY